MKKKKLTEEDCEDIKILVISALDAANKKDAESYIRKLERFDNILIEYPSIVFGELTSSVRAATGKVANKKSKSDDAIQMLNKFLLIISLNN